MAIKKIPLPWQLTLFQPPPTDLNKLVIFSLKNVKEHQKLELTFLCACWIMHMKIKMEHRRWPEKLLIWERPGTQFVAMVTELLSSYCGAHLVESYCQESNIPDTNWLRYLFSSYLNKIWLSVRIHHLANLHILKTWISLERKEIFEHSKRHFSSRVVYLFMAKNGLDRKDAIFVIVPL